MRNQCEHQGFGYRNESGEFDWATFHTWISRYYSADDFGNQHPDIRNSDNLMLQWIECDRCLTVLEFLNQPHFCCGGFIKDLNLDNRVSYLECPCCCCVLTYPGQPHRCPEAVKSREPDFCNTNSDWYVCLNCACALTSPQYPHSCLNDSFGILEATNSLLFTEEDDVPTIRRMRLWRWWFSRRQFRRTEKK